LLAQLIYFMLAAHFGWILYNGSYAKSQTAEETELLARDQNNHQLNLPTRSTASGDKHSFFCEFSMSIKIPLLTFLWFICSEFERLVLIICIITFRVFTKAFHSFKNDRLKRFFCILMIVKFSEVFYGMTRGTFFMDISLKAANKTIGEYPDVHPGFSDTLLGIHKLRCFMVGSVFMLEAALCPLVITVSKSIVQSALSISNEIKGIALMIYAKVLFAMLAYVFNFFSRREGHYLELFIWSMHKCMMSSIFLAGFVFIILLNGGKNSIRRMKPKLESLYK
jgi:hypothetical protein